jgi:hypothetical protein
MRSYLMHLPRWQRLVMGYLTADLTYVLFVRRHPVPARDQDVAAWRVAGADGDGRILPALGQAGGQQLHPGLVQHAQARAHIDLIQRDQGNIPVHAAMSF